MTEHDVSHFTVISAPAEKPIHMVWTEQDVSIVEPYVRTYAHERNLHLAVLEGKRLFHEGQIFTALGHLYEFPNEHNPNYEHSNWDGTRDHWRDLYWLAQPTAVRPHNWGTHAGFVLFYRDPLVLFSANTYAFSLLFDTFLDSVQSLGAAGTPFHMVVGPWDADERALNLLHVLTVRDRICCITEMR